MMIVSNGLRQLEQHNDLRPARRLHTNSIKFFSLDLLGMQILFAQLKGMLVLMALRPGDSVMTIPRP